MDILVQKKVRENFTNTPLLTTGVWEDMGDSGQTGSSKQKAEPPQLWTKDWPGREGGHHTCDTHQ